MRGNRVLEAKRTLRLQCIHMSQLVTHEAFKENLHTIQLCGNFYKLQRKSWGCITLQDCLNAKERILW